MLSGVPWYSLGGSPHFVWGCPLWRPSFIYLYISHPVKRSFIRVAGLLFYGLSIGFPCSAEDVRGVSRGVFVADIPTPILNPKILHI